MKSLLTIVGMKHRGTEKLVAALPKYAPLVLRREPGNKFDKNAVQVWAGESHLGYVKSAQAAELALAMDSAGHVEIPALLAVTSDKWPQASTDLDRPRSGVASTPSVPDEPNQPIIKEGRDV